MSKIISIHSFRGGTGKSNIVSSLAVLLASEGRRIGVIDTDIQSPGIHVLFGLRADEIKRSLNDYLWGNCAIEDTALDVTANLKTADGRPAVSTGKVYLIPSSMKAGEIARILREGMDVDLLRDGLRRVVQELALDVLLIDTHPGLNEETLLAIALSNTLIVIMRPDQQDFQGTVVTIEVARKLSVKRMMILVNKTPRTLDPDDVKTQVEQTYRCEVAAVLPHADEMMDLGSASVFVLDYPNHPITQALLELGESLMA